MEGLGVATVEGAVAGSGVATVEGAAAGSGVATVEGAAGALAGMGCLWETCDLFFRFLSLLTCACREATRCDFLAIFYSTLVTLLSSTTHTTRVFIRENAHPMLTSQSNGNFFSCPISSITMIGPSLTPINIPETNSVFTFSPLSVAT